MRLPALRSLLLSALVGVCAAACHGRPRSGSGSPSEGSAGATETRSHGPGTIVVLDLSRGAPESMDAGGLFVLPASRTFVGLVRALERAAKDEDATGFFVSIGTTDLGYARSEEVGRLLGELRKRGKPVVCHAHELGNASAWMALRGCDRIWLSPAGDVDTVGIAGQSVYFKRALDKLKVHADFMQVGKYKSFAEMITREGPTDEARESLVGVLSSIRASWLSDVPAMPAKTRDAMEDGPWTPEEAKARGLIHEIGYESEAREDAQERGKGDELRPGFGPKAGVGGGVSIVEILRILAGADERSGGRPHVAVVSLTGGIAMGGGGLFSSAGIGLRATTKTIRRLARDESVRAVVLRIDSPGGSALASDLLWHELRELGKKKKLIASVGEMAASGGYYLASAAERILAERTSIVGSIGVVGGKIVVGEAIEELGVDSETFPASDAPGAAARAAYLSALTPWDEPTRDRVRRQMKSIYDLFLDRVAKGRGVAVNEIAKHAEGRIWTGAQGKDRHLVDELGGLLRAIETARQLSGLDEDAPVVVSGARESILETLMLGEEADSAEVARAVASYEARRSHLVDSLARPLRPFVSSMQPLVDGEKVVTALPFVLVVR